MRAILMYHSIDPSGSAISVSPEAFHAHVRWLASGRVRVVSLAQLVRLPPEADAVAITFDDGFENFGTEAAPLLSDHGLPVTLFVVTEQVGRTNAWNGKRDPRIPELRLLQWEDLGRLTERGVSLGAHTRTHPELPRLAPAALEDEVVECAATLRARLGVDPRTFAYPFGAVSPAVVAIARKAYDVAVTTELRVMNQTEQPYLLPRLDMYYFRQPGRLERWGTSGFRRHLWFRAELRRVRRALTQLGRG